MTEIEKLKADTAHYSLIKDLIKLPTEDFKLIQTKDFVQLGMQADFSKVDDFLEFKLALERIRAAIGNDESVDDFLASKLQSDDFQEQARRINTGFTKSFFNKSKFEQVVTTANNRQDEVVVNPIDSIKQEDQYLLIKDLIGFSEDNLDKVLKKEGLTHNDEDERRLTKFKTAIKSLHDEINDQDIDEFLESNKEDTNIKENISDILDAMQDDHFNFDIVKSRVENHLSVSAPKPETPQERWDRRFKTITSDKYEYFDPTLKEQLKEMQKLLDKDEEPHKQKAAKDFLDRTIQLADNIENYEQTIKDRYQATIDKNEKRVMVAEDEGFPRYTQGIFAFHKKNNEADYKVNEQFLIAQTLTAEALLQGAKKINSMDNEDCEDLDIHKFIAPNVKSTELSDDLGKQQARVNKILAKRIFTQDGKSEQEVINGLLEARKESGYKAKNVVTNKSNSDDLWAYHKQRKTEKLESLKEKHDNMIGKDFTLTKLMMTSRLQDEIYKDFQDKTFKELKESDPEKVKGKTPDDIKLSDMKSIKLRGIQFENDGNGNFSPNHHVPRVLRNGKTRTPNKSDMTKGMVRLLMLMQAEGKTEFNFLSSSPKAIKAFRAAVKACNIPPEQVNMRQIDPNNPTKTKPIKATGSTLGVMHTAMKEYKKARNESTVRQAKMLQQQRIEQQQQQMQEQRMEQEESQSPRTPQM